MIAPSHTIIACCMGSDLDPRTSEKEGNVESAWCPTVWLAWGLKRMPPALRGPDTLQRPLKQPPPIAGWVHPWVNRSGSSEGLRLQEETAVRATSWKQEYGSSRGFDLQFHFARNGDFFFFFSKKHWTSLNFRPFTNIFLGQKRRKKKPHKMPVTATHFHNESWTQNHSYVANKETMCFHISLLEII